MVAMTTYIPLFIIEHIAIGGLLDIVLSQVFFNMNKPAYFMFTRQSVFVFA